VCIEWLLFDGDIEAKLLDDLFGETFIIIECLSPGDNSDIMDQNALYNYEWCRRLTYLGIYKKYIST